MNTNRPLTDEGVISNDPEIKEELNDALNGEIAVKDNYRGFFVRFEPIDEKGKGLLAGSNCAIGTELHVDFEKTLEEYDNPKEEVTEEDKPSESLPTEETQKPRVATGPFSSIRNAIRVARGQITEEEMYGLKPKEPTKNRGEELEELIQTTAIKDSASKDKKLTGAKLLTKGNDIITLLDLSDSDNIKKFLDAGWNVKMLLSLVAFKNETNRFWGEMMVVCYKDNPKIHKDTFSTYFKNLRKRVTSGEHPQATLSQKQFNSLIESRGTWNMAPIAPLPKLGRGELVFKRKASWHERLMRPAAEGNLGCTIASIVAWILVAVIVLALLATNGGLPFIKF